MSLNRYACRRDANETDIVDAAKQLGVQLWPLKTPCDWLALIGGRWYPCEIKGAKGKLTEAQVKFRKAADDAGAIYLLWRSVDEMISDVQRLRVTR